MIWFRCLHTVSSDCGANVEYPMWGDALDDTDLCRLDRRVHVPAFPRAFRAVRAVRRHDPRPLALWRESGEWWIQHAFCMCLQFVFLIVAHCAQFTGRTDVRALQPDMLQCASGRPKGRIERAGVDSTVVLMLDVVSRVLHLHSLALRFYIRVQYCCSVVSQALWWKPCCVPTQHTFIHSNSTHRNTHTHTPSDKERVKGGDHDHGMEAI